MIPRKVLRTDSGRAAVAQAWLDGYSQKRIASECFGYRTSYPICEAIATFVRVYAPEIKAGCYTLDYVPTAIARFIAARDAVDRAATP